ncbi:hypothetical protein PZE06_11870 [Robertmurraya sp. DFI.2.37]|uniref:hypothetical protein n=1 Tax=Robertmurraya sp. DFI.2.37 TaxID=3031819 RepID=UPI001CDA4F2C|nr:hypothetical protein [Robertmurraya sp. DFI.2.37]MDF1508870.1 hypothetical protein [Robertmurraya sp. DFI.2.37]
MLWKRLEPLKAKKAADRDKLTISEVEQEWFISAPDGKRTLYSFIAFATGEQV